MRYVVDGIGKVPHPEEAVKRPSRRTHGAHPADRQFVHRLFRGDDARPADIWEGSGQKKARVRISMLSRGRAWGGVAGSSKAVWAVNRARPSFSESYTL